MPLSARHAEPRVDVRRVLVWAVVLLVSWFSLSACESKESEDEGSSGTTRVSSTTEPVPAGTETAPGWTVVSEDALDEAQRAKVQAARKAQKALGKTLKGRLQAVVESEGFAAAVDVCHVEAPQLARQVRQDHSLEIGRTSFRLRNPDNTPPNWAEPIVAKHSEAPHVLTGPDDTVAVMTPIFADGLCLNCHGSDDWRAEGVDPILAEHYPQDEAIGFEPGDLRGWFWAEVE